MKKIPFSVTMEFIALLKKMGFDFDVEIHTTNELMSVLFKELVLKMPNAQDEFIALLAKISEKDITTDTDTFEVLAIIKEEFESISKAFSQALKLKSMI